MLKNAAAFAVAGALFLWPATLSAQENEGENAQQPAPPPPCSEYEHAGGFDFWIGEWDVYVRGKHRAVSHITKELNGCLVRERYQGVQNDFKGESLNYIDPRDGLWRQNWADMTGGVVRYFEGTPGENVMRMTGHNISRTGTVRDSRVIWKGRDDGSVLHLIEHSKDGGETWEPYFFGLYVPAGADAPEMADPPSFE